jgi:hypothetical protein
MRVIRTVCVFTLRRDVVVERSPQAQAALKGGKESITLTGALEYQAGDDKVCFNPVSLPLTWTMSLRPLITARPTAPPR